MRTRGSLIRLRQVREEAGLSQKDMAIFFGFTGPNGRNTVARWENGEGSPPALKHRATFMVYLGNKLGLRNDHQRFEEVWGLFEDRWNWPPISDCEWEDHLTTGNAQPSEEVELPRWKMKVYHFDNHGSNCEREKIGERFSGLILDSLLQRKTQISSILEKFTTPPVMIYAYRAAKPTYFEDVSKLRQTIFITGYIEESGDIFTAHVRVTYIGSLNTDSGSVMIKEVEFRNIVEDMHEKASMTADTIYAMMVRAEVLKEALLRGV